MQRAREVQRVLLRKRVVAGILPDAVSQGRIGPRPRFTLRRNKCSALVLLFTQKSPPCGAAAVVYPGGKAGQRGWQAAGPAPRTREQRLGNAPPPHDPRKHSLASSQPGRRSLKRVLELPETACCDFCLEDLGFPYPWSKPTLCGSHPDFPTLLAEPSNGAHSQGVIFLELCSGLRWLWVA